MSLAIDLDGSPVGGDDLLKKVENTPRHHQEVWHLLKQCEWHRAQVSHHELLHWPSINFHSEMGRKTYRFPCGNRSTHIITVPNPTTGTRRGRRRAGFDY